MCFIRQNVARNLSIGSETAGTIERLTKTLLSSKWTLMKWTRCSSSSENGLGKLEWLRKDGMMTNAAHSFGLELYCSFREHVWSPPWSVAPTAPTPVTKRHPWLLFPSLTSHIQPISKPCGFHLQDASLIWHFLSIPLTIYRLSAHTHHTWPESYVSGLPP